MKLLKLLQKRYLTAAAAGDLVHNCSANTSSASLCSPYSKPEKKIPKTESRGAWNWNLCTTCWPSCLSELLDLTSEMCFDVLLTKMKHPEEASHWKRAWRLVLLVFFSYKGCVCPVQQSAFLVLVLLLPYYIANTFISRTSGQGRITSRMHQIPCDSALCIVSVSVCAKDYLG